MWENNWTCAFLVSYRRIHSFHWHVQNATIPCCSQELLPYLSVMYFFLPPFSTNYSSILPRLILPSISWSTPQLVVPKFIYNTLLGFYFLPFSVHAQTNVIYLTLQKNDFFKYKNSCSGAVIACFVYC